ncbi:MAG: branched-chain amino acid ABC transporter substrate-binding protein, partial [Dongiaceae bacterium]
MLALLGGVSACAPASGGTIKIYVSLPLQNPQGASTQKAIALAVKQAGQRAGAFQVVLVSKTDGDESGHSVGASEEANAREAVADPDVMAFIGPLDSDMAHISIPITNRGGLAHISPSNTASDLTKSGFSPGRPGEFYPTGRRNYFRTCPTDDAQGPAAAAWARELGYQSVYILDDGEVYGAGVADQFELKAGDTGIAVLGRETIDAAGVSAALGRIAEADPDLVYYGGYTENGAPLVITQMREMALRADFMVPDGAADAQFLEKAGAAAEGVWSTLVGVPPAQLSG